MSSQIYSSMKYVVTWKDCEKEAVLSTRTFEDFHDARMYATRRYDKPGITVDKMKTVIEIENLPQKLWFLPN